MNDPSDPHARRGRRMTLRARTHVRRWVERDRFELLSVKAVIAVMALALIMLIAMALPLAPALFVCAIVAAAYTVWFYEGLVLTPRKLHPRDLGWVAMAWAVALWWWSVFTEILWRHDIVHFSGAAQQHAGLGTTAEFFLWNLVDLVPLVDIDRSLRWEEPVDYDPFALVGWCLLLYELFVVLPVIALVRRALGQTGRDQRSPQ
jgi:hypothetical protein